ncbi:MAG: transcriptional repressor [Chloroflexi bacterium]|nr:transcriptional repressor [Chloroflexota bacterium]
MSCEQDSATVLRRADMKLTPQRLMVLTALRHASGHVSAAEVFEQVRTAYPYVDISTVYRTLGALKQMRLVTETDMGAGDLAYEWVQDGRHHHLICTACNSVYELDHSFLQRLGAEIERERGFAADLDHFAIFGRCRACRAAVLR